MARKFFRGHVVIVDRFDPEHPELEGAETLGLFADIYPHIL
ncbi:hypothetical protein [Rothia dentocariosa]